MHDLIIDDHIIQLHFFIFNNFTTLAMYCNMKRTAERICKDYLRWLFEKGIWFFWFFFPLCYKLWPILLWYSCATLKNVTLLHSICVVLLNIALATSSVLYSITVHSYWLFAQIPKLGFSFAEEKSNWFAYNPCNFLGKMLTNSFPLVDFSIWLALSIDEWVMTHYLPQSAAQGTSHLPPIWFPLNKSSSQDKRKEAGSEKARAASNQTVGIQLTSSINRTVILLVCLWH